MRVAVAVVSTSTHPACQPSSVVGSRNPRCGFDSASAVPPRRNRESTDPPRAAANTPHPRVDKELTVLGLCGGLAVVVNKARMGIKWEILGGQRNECNIVDPTGTTRGWRTEPWKRSVLG